MVMDFRRGAPRPSPLVTKREEVEVVHQYKCQGTTLKDRLDADSLLKKGTLRMHCLKKLRSFRVCPKLLELFYPFTVESIFTFGSPLWLTGLKAPTN